MKMPYPIQPTRPPAPVTVPHIIWAVFVPLAAAGFAYLVTLAALAG